MKIINWNIYKKNRNIQKAITFLRQQQADVICLQEFPIDQINLIENIGFYITTCEEVHIYHKKQKPIMRAYSVILSRFPIIQSSVIPHKKRYMPSNGKREKYAYFQADTLSADIDTPQGLFRVFNIHFKCFAGPHHRLSQFAEVMKHLSPERHNMVCGDFNSFGKPWVNVLLWKLFYFRIQDIPINESKRLAKILKTHHLQNPLEHQVTFLKFPVQLDYILIPEHLEVKAKRAFFRLHGSDHFPLMLEV